MSAMKPLTSVFILALALGLATVAHAQKKPGKSVDVVTNLLVVDEKGAYVSGVKQGDVRIYEGGVEQQLTSLVHVDEALDLAFVTDNTGSVRTQMEDVTKIGKILVANLRDNDSAQVIRFVGRDNVSIEQVWTNNRASLVEAFDDMFVEGGQSAVIDALYLASEDILKRYKQYPSRRYAVVLISDGEDRASYFEEKELYKLLAGTPVQIFSITLAKELPRSFWSLTDNRKTAGWVVKFVNRLAAHSGGTSYVLREKSTKDDLTQALKALLTELRSQYLIKYTASDVTKENNVRKLAATVADGPNGEKRTAYIKSEVVLVPQ